MNIVAAAGSAALVLLLLVADDGLANHAADLSFAAFPALAAVSSWSASRSRAGRQRWGLLLLATAWSTYALGGVVWTAEGWDGARPYPSVADGLFLTYCVPAVGGLLLLGHRGTGRWARLRHVLDGLVIFSASVFLSAVLVLGPVFESPSSGLARVTSLAYPCVDLVMLALVLTLLVRTAAQGRAAWLLLAVGFFGMAAVDSLYARQVLDGTYVSGGVASATYAVAFSVFAVAVHRLGTTSPRTSRPSGWQEWLPYLLVLPCALFAAFHDVSFRRPGLLALFVLVMVVHGVRQLVLITEKVNLADHLEVRVAERTTRLNAQQEFLQAVIENLSDQVVACDADGLVTVYHAGSGDAASSQFVLDDWLESPDRGEFLRVDTMQPMPAADLPLVRALRGESVVEQEFAVHHSAGDDIYLSASGRALRSPQGVVTGAVIANRDVTEQRRAREGMKRRALTDELTGLGNRARFNDDMVRARERNGRVAVLLLDLDDFKKVNDSLGHHAGDALLVEIARRLRVMVRAGDTAARLGGDEFVLVLHDSSAGAARALADRLVEAVAEPVSVHGTTLSVSVSVGVAAADPEYPQQDLLAAADLAMYQAKERGRGGCRGVRTADAAGGPGTAQPRE